MPNPNTVFRVIVTDKLGERWYSRITVDDHMRLIEVPPCWNKYKQERLSKLIKFLNETAEFIELEEV